MADLTSLYIERNDCGNCYRCARECVVKAVSRTETGAAIDPDRCVECGACLSWCHDGAVRLRDDVFLARKFIKSYMIKVASLSPQWVTEFPELDAGRMVEALKLLGFTHVSESALGGEAVLKREKELLAEREGISISSRCPAIADYIRKYKPRLASHLLPVATPMLAHARMIRSWWGHEARIIHISSCVAAKSEAARNPDLVELALTFTELRRWMSDEGIDSDHIVGGDSYQFEPFTARAGLLYPLAGGGAGERRLADLAASGAVHMVRSSLDPVKELLDGMTGRETDHIYLDLMACPNGCLGSNGATAGRDSYLAQCGRLNRAAASRRMIDESYNLPYVSLDATPVEDEAVSSFVAESDTLRALDSLGLSLESAQIDCNGCGYGTCRRFAKALSRGVVCRQMCTHYVQTELSSRFTTLVNRLAAGVAVVTLEEGRVRVAEANRQLASMMGPDVESLYDASSGCRGAEAERLFPFVRLVNELAESGDESLVRDVQVREHMLTVSVHVVQRGKVYLVICRNMLFSQVRNEEIVSRTQRVIRENLDTVQQIAALLGENASRTEAILNSILDTHSGVKNE